MYGEPFVTSGEWIALWEAEEERGYWAEQATIDQLERESDPGTVEARESGVKES